MALGMYVVLGLGHIVLDGDPATLPRKGAEPPIFGPFLLWLNSWMHQDATWYGSIGLDPGHIMLAPLPKKGHSPLPIFGGCLLWPNGCMLGT